MSIPPSPDPTVLVLEYERLREQTALLEGELSRFRSMVEEIDLLITEVESNGIFTYVNGAARRFFGYAPEECIGRLWLEFVHPDDLEDTRQAFMEWVQRRERSGMIENRITHRDGSLTHTLWSITLHYDDQGAVQRAISIAYDIGAMQRIARESRESRAMLQNELHTFKLLVENAPDGIGIADTNLVFTYANPALAAMLAYPDLVGRTVMEITHPDDLAVLNAITEQVARGETPRETIRYLNAKGATVTVQASALALRDGQGNLIGYASINRDITAQLAAEESLYASEQRNRALLNAIPDLLFVLNTDGVFLDFKADDYLLLPPEAFLNRKIGDVLPPHLAEQTLTHMEELKRTHTMQTFEYQIVINDTLRDFEARMVLSNDDVLVLSRDVTKQKRAERERQAMQERIIEAQQATLRELSTPLMPIADGVVVMPLIGTIDTLRAQQIMEALLEGISDHYARFAILDITGVKVVDTQVAAALIRSAQAARMLGARMVLTGISPEIAQTLVHIGADMREMITKPTLQQGIAHVLEQRK
jgi:rsbT co-antagonist protein RsbR